MFTLHSLKSDDLTKGKHLVLGFLLKISLKLDDDYSFSSLLISSTDLSSNLHLFDFKLESLQLNFSL